jgi:hypothetical protein
VREEGATNLATWQKLVQAEKFFPEPFYNIIFLLLQRKRHPG